MGNYGKDFYDSVVVSAREARESLDSVKVKCSFQTCLLSPKGWPDWSQTCALRRAPPKI